VPRVRFVFVMIAAAIVVGACSSATHPSLSGVQEAQMQCDSFRHVKYPHATVSGVTVNKSGEVRCTIATGTMVFCGDHGGQTLLTFSMPKGGGTPHEIYSTPPPTCSNPITLPSTSN
jgi:hypothetical protein